MPEPILSIRNLSVGFRDTETKEVINVLRDVSIDVPADHILGIVGESGCGKSVTMHTVMGLLPRTAVVTAGQIRYDNRDLLGLNPVQMNEYRGKEIAMIFQEPMTSLNPVYRVGDQIAEMLELHQDISHKDALAEAVRKLELVSIPSPEKVAEQYPHELSGGMRQRVMIAIAMACDPKILIADEPTTALDVTIQAQILALMKALKEKMHSSIILITHDLGVVAEMADEVVVMYAGDVVEKALVVNLFREPSHPYTTGLLKSLPMLHSSDERLYNIVGTVPSPRNFPEACRFAPRCEFVHDRCLVERPRLVRIAPDHEVACWLRVAQGAA
ncbi:MAG: ABC transporter ATP-binding protein [Anaerolineae bacterium]|jgi:oligopeptide/dipeptide ABC transporter ATP-binding protein|nr:ABC transporter ATP-binding protein [Anaerolineae bacterium]